MYTNKQYPVKSIFLFIVITICLLASANAQSTWTAKANFSCTPRNGAAFFVIGTKAYVGTGEDADSLRSDFWQWDICSNTWTQVTNFPGAPRTSASGFTIGANGYVGLGWDNWHGTIGGPFFTDMYEYSPSLNTWTRKADFGGAGREQASCLNIHDSIYITLGYSGYSLNDVWAYNAANDTWVQKNDFPGSNRRDASCFTIANRGYMGTGYDENTGAVNDFWEYNPTIDTWTKKANFGGVARHLGVGFSIGNIGYIGLGTGNGGLVNDFWSWNPSTDVWTKQADFGGSSRDVAVGFSVGCRGYVGLGGDYPSPPTAIDFWEFYDPANPYPCFASPVDAGPDVTICNGMSTTLNGTGGNVAGYTWSPAAGLSNATIANPVASPTVTTPYILMATGGSGCTVTNYVDIVTVTVTPGITLNLFKDTTVCDGEPVLLNPGASTGSNYYWNPATGLNCYLCSSPLATPVTNVTYTVTVDSGSCTVIDSVKINLGGKAVGGIITAVRDTICYGTTGSLTLSGNSSNNIQWQSLDSVGGLFTPIGVNDTIKYKTSPMTQTTWYRAQVGSGHCTALSDTLQLVVPPLLIASFTSLIDYNSRTVTYNSGGSNGSIVSYYWDFGDGITGNIPNPVHIYAKDSVYYVCLTIYDGSNCSYTYCRSVEIEPDGVSSVAGSAGWNIYPNPFSSILNIEAKNADARVMDIEVYDLIGRLRISKSFGKFNTENIRLNVSLLTKGVYILKIKTEQGTSVYKVSKQ